MIDDVCLTWFFAVGTFVVLSIAHQPLKICPIKNTRFMQQFRGEFDV